MNIEELLNEIPNLVQNPNDDQGSITDPGTSNPPTEDPPEDNPPADTPPTDNPPADEPPTEDPPTDNPPTEDPSNKPDTKAAQAFAQMRIALNQKDKQLRDIVKALGLTDSNKEEDISKAVTDKIVELKAKQRNIPEDVVRELEDLKKQQRESLLMQRRMQVTADLVNVQKNYNLSSADLTNFVDTLIQDGINPYEQNVDLSTEYLKRNLSSIIAAAEERGRAAEAKRAITASVQSSNPNGPIGSTVDGQAGKQTIDSINALDNILDELTKK